MVRYRQEGPQSWCLITKTRCAGDVACATRDIALFLCERCVEWHGIRSWILRDLKRVWSGLSFLRRAQHSQLRVKTGRHVVGASLGPSETPANFAWRVSNLSLQHSSPRFSTETTFDYISYKTVTLVPL
jgi:hypothetical protein